jgi:hypothetical protein
MLQNDNRYRREQILEEKIAGGAKEEDRRYEQRLPLTGDIYSSHLMSCCLLLG